MNIEDLTLGQIRELQALLSPQTKEALQDHGSGFPIGKNVFIRTVTMHLTGRLVAVTPTEFVLEDAAWIASSGRFADFLAHGTPSEVEPYPKGKVWVGRGALIDMTEYGFALPTEQK